MFKLSVITDEVSQDLEEVVKFAIRNNLQAVEIRTIWNLKPQELLPRVNEIKKILSRYKLRVSAIASPFFKANINSEKEYKEHLEILKKSIKLAKYLGTNIVRGFTFWREGKLEDYIDKIIEKFQEPLDIIEKENITLAIENEPSTFIGNGKKLAYFLRKINSKNLKAVFDPGNDIWDPEHEVPYPDGYNYVKEYIIHVHIKDGIRKDNTPEFTPVGDGEVNYHEFLKALIRDKYDGYLSLETHWRPKRKLKEELVKKPGGVKYSRLGEEASQICIEKLKKIIDEVIR